MGWGSVLEFDNVTLNLHGREIFSGLSFKIERNSHTCLIGPSGTGKSMIFDLMLGFKTPSGGTIYFEGHPLNGNNVTQLRQQVAWVPQFFDLNYAANEILENIKSSQANQGHQLEDLSAWLTEFSLAEEVLKRRIATLSGGEKSRLCLAMGLSLNRPILMLDEVTASLDAKNKKAIVRAIRAQKSKTIISIAHEASYKKLCKNEIKVS